MDKTRKDNLLDKQIDRELIASEMKEMELFYENPNQLKKEMNLRKDISKGIEYLSDKEFKSMLEEIHLDEILGKKEPFNKSIAILSICLIAFSLLTYLFFKFDNSSNDFDSEKVFAEYYNPYKSYPESRGAENQNTIVQFSNHYRIGDFKNALDIILPIIDEVDNELTLLSGISALEEEKYVLSKSLFDKIIENNDEYYIDHALWYKSMMYIKMKNMSNAKVLLSILSEKQGADHQKEAEALLIEINKK